MYLPNSSAVIMMMYLCGAMGMDIWKRKISNEYILCGYIVLPFIQDIRVIILESIILGICIIPLYIFKVLGAGDIKLLCILAGYFSANQILNVLIYAFILTAFATVIIKLYLRLSKKNESIQKFPFTLPLLLSLISHIWR